MSSQKNDNFWTITAQHRLREILDYISKDDAQTALDFIQFIADSAAELIKFPQKGLSLKIKSVLEIHEFIIHKHESINYEVLDKELRILRIHHFSQQFDSNLI